MAERKINEMVRQLRESVSIDTNPYMNAHRGRLPKGRGMWIFSVNKPKTGEDPDYGNEQEYFTHTGSYLDAKREATKWAKSLRKRTSVIYVLG